MHNDMLSDDAWNHTMDVHDAALASTTRANYARARVKFLEWAAAERVGLPATRMPIAEPLLCAFAASFAGHLSGGAVRSVMAGLRFEHEKAGLHWVGSPRLIRILSAVSQLAPDDTCRDPRPPVTLAMLDEALHALDPKRRFDQCVGAAMLVAFWGQLRLGEVLSETRRYDYDKLPRRRHLQLRYDAGGTADVLTTTLWLPKTKTARRGERICLARRHNDPSFALQEHIADNVIGPEDPLFAYRNDDGALIPLTKRAFLSRLNEIWAAAGMRRISGHCFRIGGTTALLRLGIDTDVIKISGRWKSDSFLRYWRSVDNIVASHTDLCDVFWSGDD